MSGLRPPPVARDWNAKDASLLPPFDQWPCWATTLDLEISLLVGDVGATEMEETPEGKATLEAYEEVRDLIRQMVSGLVT